MTQPSIPVAWFDPLLDGEDYARKQWFYHTLYQKILKSTDPHVWESHWVEGAKWREEQKDEYSLPAIALRACLYMAGKNPGSEHAKSIISGLSDGRIPEDVLDVWSTAYFRFKFLKDLIADKTEQSHDLLSITIEKWPWMWGAVSAHVQEFYYQPAYLLMRHERLDLFEQMQNTLPAERWIVFNDYASMKALWRDRVDWREDQFDWLDRVLSYDARLKDTDGKTGKDVLAQAAIEHKVHIFQKLLEMGLSPHPEKSFGLTPCHWAATGLSETGWDPVRQQSIPKDPLDIEKQALKCGKMLAVLEHLGFSPDEKVIKVPKTEYRRPPGLVKVGLSAWDYLEDRLQSKSKSLTPETLALVRQAYLAQSQPQPTLSSSMRSRRL